MNHVLVPTDGSDCSASAAHEAILVAKSTGARVHLFHAVSPATVREAGIDPGEATPESLERFAEGAFDAVDPVVSEAGVSSARSVRVGHPAEGICAHAAATGVDIVAMGTHGRTGIRRHLLGSVAERVVRTAPVPVLTTRARKDDARPYREILLPTDGSDAATAGVEFGLQFADAFDSRVHVLSVVDRRLLASSIDVGPARTDDVERLHARSERAVRDAVERARERGVTVVSRVVEGIPHSQIQQFVEHNDVDLVAMGTHGRTGRDRLALGSVAERTVRETPVPVLTARPAPHHGEAETETETGTP